MYVCVEVARIVLWSDLPQTSRSQIQTVASTIPCIHAIIYACVLRHKNTAPDYGDYASLPGTSGLQWHIYEEGCLLYWHSDIAWFAESVQNVTYKCFLYRSIIILFFVLHEPKLFHKVL